MNTGYLLLVMIFCHIVDDYYLQGWLASAKQKKWWKDNAPNEIYKYDYIWALIMHSFSWAFMIMLPIAFHLKFDVDAGYFALFVANLCLHAFVDDRKANRGKINLWEDQLIHITQIVSTWIYFMVN